ncbi:MAG: hypothetical protein II621_02605, partial [Clostridia bacterium]|nr:hypothetical protein [Clostridia bacterium]
EKPFHVYMSKNAKAYSKKAKTFFRLTDAGLFLNFTPDILQRTENHGIITITVQAAISQGECLP